MSSFSISNTTKQHHEKMYVIKRSGEHEIVQFDKITRRLSKLLYDGLDENIDPIIITQKICSRIYPGITTTELDNLASQVCMSMIVDHPDFGILGGRIVVSNHQKNTLESFRDVVKLLASNKDIKNNPSPLVNDELIQVVEKHGDYLESIIDFNRDFAIDFFGFKTLERSYLLKVNTNEGGKKGTKIVVERPQHLFLRVAIGIHGFDLENVQKTYDNISLMNYTHATPTLFNAGCPINQCCSCYLSSIEDSIEGIFDTYRDCGLISKYAGGIGVHISNIRSKGSYIRKTGGTSSGLMPLLKTFNDIARQFDQGGRRLGSFAMYLEPHHADIFTFLNAKKNVGADEEKAKDLFYALWVSDYFMECVEGDLNWYLMDPNNCPNLNEVYGNDYKTLYLKYVSEDNYIKKIRARELWEAIISAQVELGLPYICYKNAVNTKSNQKNIGVIKSSNLCVSGDTMILTSTGYHPIESLHDEEVEVWNGNEWSKTTVRKTGEYRKVIKVTFSNGMELKCTPYHKFNIIDEQGDPKTVEAQQLKQEMEIVQFKTPIVEKPLFLKEMVYPYTHGFFRGTGIGSNSTPLTLTLSRDRFDLLMYLNYDCIRSYDKKNDTYTLVLLSTMKHQFYVPLTERVRIKLRWLEGYIDASDSYISSDNQELTICSIDKDILTKISYLLQTLSIQSAITQNYDLQPIYHLKIFNDGLQTLRRLGLSPKRINIFLCFTKETRTIEHRIKVKDIVDEGEYCDTFCFNEPIEHKGVFNGILTFNCSEIMEVSSSTETAVCNLASICLPNVLEYQWNDENKWLRLLTSFERSIYNLLCEGKLKLVTIPNCVYCKLLKTLLRRARLTFEEITPEDGIELVEMSGIKTYPQLFVILESNYLGEFVVLERKEKESKYIGGYTDVWNVLKPRINHDKLRDLAAELTVNLNTIIDKTYYPIEKTRVSNLRHRPIGIGVQGLANVFMILKLSFTSDEARQINKDIFESIYYGAMKSSLELSKINGPYSTFNGSPLSEGKFQFNLWGVSEEQFSGRWDWNELRNEIMKFGVRNSLLIALMPTASTASIFGNVESFEAITSNLYVRHVLSGVFTIFNKHLIQDLLDLELWTKESKDRLIYDKGSVQRLRGLPPFLKDVYKTAYEIDQKLLIKMSAERAIFVCQSQSLNLFFDKPTFKDLTSAHFFGWKQGLKTGSYYIRTKAGSSAQSFGLDAKKELLLKNEDKQEEEEVGCISCSS